MSHLDIIEIADRCDPRIAPYVSVRERDLTGGADGRFIVEGKVALSTLLTRSRFAVDSLFLCDTRLKPLDLLLSKVPPGIPVYVASQNVMDSIAGFAVHRGVLACARKRPAPRLDTLLAALPAGPQTVLVLNRLSNHDNVGAAFRNAAAFGAQAVILDRQSCDPLYRKAIRVSSGTTLWLPYLLDGCGLSHVSQLEQAGFTLWAMTPDPGAPSLYTLNIPDRLAIMLGNEGDGLQTEVLEAARPVRIPMVTGMDSVNVATAGAIALGHVYAARGRAMHS